MSSLPNLEFQASRSATMPRPTLPAAFFEPSSVGGYGERTDTRLLGSARDGDGAAYAVLWERYRGTASRIARRYLHAHDADDAVSESFAQIWATLLAGGGPTQSFGAYLAVSVRNNAGRLTTRNRSVPVDATERSVLDQAVEDPDSVGDDLERDLAVAAFKTLSARHQRALMLSIEQDTNSAADSLGLSRRGYTSLAFRARENLRRAYLSAYVEPGVSAEVDDQCRRFRNLLGAHVRGGLRESERHDLEVHLLMCATCDKVYQEVLELNATMPSPQRISAIAIPLVPVLVGGWIAGLWGVSAKSAGAGASAGLTGTLAGAAGAGLLGGVGATVGGSGIAIGGTLVGVSAVVVAAVVILPGVLPIDGGRIEARSSLSVGSEATGGAGSGREVTESGSADSPGSLLPPFAGVSEGKGDSGSEIVVPGTVNPSGHPNPSPSSTGKPTGTQTGGPGPGPTNPLPDPNFVDTWQIMDNKSATLSRANSATASGLNLKFEGPPDTLHYVTLRMEAETTATSTTGGTPCKPVNASTFECAVSLDSVGVGVVKARMPISMIGQQVVFDVSVVDGETMCPGCIPIAEEHRFVVDKL